MKEVKAIFFLSLMLILLSPSESEAFKIKDIVSVAKGPLIPFGGKILEKEYKVCLIPAPPPINVIPYPFVVYEIGPPRPGEFYYLYGVSTTYRRYQREVTAWSLGNAVGLADDAFRKVCRNGAFLPDVDGIILKIGTSCVEGETSCE